MTRIPLAQYLFKRLRSQGVHAIHGVPGDFTLKALDHLPPSGVKWIGNCNELNAGYAADGYARVRGLGALFTTYGVGELSAINAVAGSFSESVPVVHIVGTPQRRLQDARANVHHTLGDGRPRVFAQMHRPVTVAQTDLRDETTAPEDIDRTVAAALEHSRPVYIELPCDMVSKEVDAAGLEVPLVDRFTTTEEFKARDEDALVADIVRRLYGSKRPLVLVDSGDGLRSPSLRREVNEFVKRSGLPTLCMPSGSGMVDHALGNYYGVHSGPVGQIDTMPYVNGADLVLAFGPMFSDTQTLGWKVVPEPEKTITMGKNHLSLPTRTSTTLSRINLHSLLPRLTKLLDKTLLSKPDVSTLGDFRTVVPRPRPTSASTSTANEDGQSDDDPIDQTNFYLRLNPYLRPDDVVLLGNATPILGGRDLVLPTGSQVIASGQWFSIGHMLPAALGASLARQQTVRNGGRTILLDGDGSFQVTAQELSTVIRYRVDLTIFLINNSGYAYERQIHGMNEDYNDLSCWNYMELPFVFSNKPHRNDDGTTTTTTTTTNDNRNHDEDDEYPIKSYVIRTWREMDTLLASEEFCTGKGLRFVDVRMDKFDVPEKFRVVFKRAGEQLG
ncbi:uncharacterized protein PV06_05360 [Exophiala oligosperma]|uniref:Pyruvate decarboxylase n=1 Tax=Exophiala oligosperma TaxID=215243 RepID=A0A0D2AX28_9EURO|nr:uncharacterized protein PV06_05360 [Exophiala oligosperma]KIW44346.1 hypothetical protein PV06_05360 [Exophiala oligosperma]